ncbi:MAG TPA: DUF481 domain-containing protein [Gammaproteobacteria bacterium]|nr:DUF481 domain-containing protein [Gammaproteobacteria bacterium]
MIKKTILMIPLLLMSTSLMAKDGVSGAVETGFVFTSGNTDTRTVNAKGKLAYIKGKSRNTASLEALYVDGEQGKLSEKYLGQGKTAYQFSEHSYGFVNGSLERDLFSGYDYQATLTTGYGYRFIDTKKFTLDVEGGPGYRRNKLDKQNAEGELIGRASGLFAYRVAKTSTFTEELVSEFGSDAVITRSVTAITAQIVGNMAMKASLTIKNNSNTPMGVDATDTETALTLVYSF